MCYLEMISVSWVDLNMLYIYNGPYGALEPEIK